MLAQQFVVVTGGVPLIVFDRPNLCRPWAIGRNFTGQAMGGLVKVVRGLHRQRTAWVQLVDQVRVERGVVGQPLQRGIGQNHIQALRRMPGADICQLEVQPGQALAGLYQHVIGAVHASDVRLGETLGQHFGGVSRPAPQVDCGAHVGVGNCRNQVTDRASALLFEHRVLLGGPGHHSLPSFLEVATA